MKAAEKEARRSFLGASDFAAVLGVDPWKKPIDIFMAKTGQTQPEDDAEEGPAAWGRFLERVIIQRWMKAHPDLPLTYAGKRTRSFVHPVYPFISATPDAYYRARPVGPVAYAVEAKTSRYGKGFGEPGTDEIPRGYKVQAIVQSAVTGAAVIYLPVLIAGSDPRDYIVEPTDAQREAVIAAGVEFWNEHVLKGIPPDEISEEYARSKWPTDDGEDLVATDDDVKLVETYRLARTNREQTEVAEDEAKLAIMARIGDRSRILGPGFAISWKKTKDVEKTDWKLLAGDLEKLLRDNSLGGILIVNGQKVALDEAIGFVRSMHTETRDGSRVFRPMWYEEDER